MKANTHATRVAEFRWLAFRNLAIEGFQHPSIYPGTSNILIYEARWPYEYYFKNQICFFAKTLKST